MKIQPPDFTKNNIPNLKSFKNSSNAFDNHKR